MNLTFMPLFRKRSIIVFFLVSIFFASLFSIQNTGGRAGIYSPYNVAVYTVVWLFVLFTLLRCIAMQRVYFSKLIGYLFCLMAGLLLTSSVETDYSFEKVWQSWFAGGTAVLFVWAVSQYAINKKQWRDILLWLCVLAFLQVLISLIQRFDVFSIAYLWTGYFPFHIHGRYTGSLQQINMLTTFISFTLTISIYLISHHSFSKHSIFVKTTGLIFVVLASFIVLSSGSRAGVLTLVVALAFMVSARFKYLKIQLKFSLLWLLAFLFGVALSLLFPNEFSVIDKFGNIVGGVDARLFLYLTSWQLFLERPWFGYGLGGFNEALVQQALLIGVPDYFGETLISFTHPHNEWLFWIVQSGVFAFVALPAFVIWALYKIIQQHGKVFWVWMGFASPFLIEAQLSYPFTLSAIHLFGLLLLVAVAMRTQKKRWALYWPHWVNQGAYSGLMLVLLMTFMASLYSIKSVFESYYFYDRYFLYKKYPKMEQQGYYRYASWHPSYRRYVVSDMNNMLSKAFKKNNRYDMKQYLLWADNFPFKNHYPDIAVNEFKIRPYIPN